MAPNKVKLIGKQKAGIQHYYNTWNTLKPFVHFALKATGFIAGTLIAIIKSIPKPVNNNENREIVIKVKKR